MKPFLKFIIAITALVIASLIVHAAPTVQGAFIACAAAAVVYGVIAQPTAHICATLSVTEILMDTMDALKVMVPQLTAFSTDFSSKTAVKDQQIIAHISSLPSVQDYDATTGFKANAANAHQLVTDVPVTLNRLKHVPVKVAYLQQLASKKNLYEEAIRNQAYVLGKSIVDYGLSLVLAANFSTKKVEAVVDSDLDTLEAIRTLLNTNAAAPIGRFGIVNSSVAAVMQADTRIMSADYYAILNGAAGYRTFQGVAGFENIWEYPDFPANGEVLQGFFGDRRAITVAARVPEVQSAAKVLGIPDVARFETVTDPTSGLTLLGIAWQEQGTFDAYVTLAVLYGATAGKQGGSNGTILDKTGVRLATA